MSKSRVCLSALLIEQGHPRWDSKRTCTTLDRNAHMRAAAGDNERRAFIKSEGSGGP